MANTFKTQSFLVGLKEQADLYLKDSVAAPYLTNSSMLMDKFAAGSGSTIRIKNSPVISVTDQAANLGSTITATDIVQTETLVSLSKYFPVRVALNALEATTSVEDIFADLVLPAINGIQDAIEAAVSKEIVAGFAVNISGTAGNQPSTYAHLQAGEQVLFANQAPTDNLVALLNPVAYGSIQALAVNTSSDYQGANQNLAMNKISALTGIKQFARSRFGGSNTLDRGYITGTVLVKGASQSGSTLAVDGFTAATGTTKRGTRITIAGVTGTYTLIADAVIAGNETVFVLDRAVASAPADNAAITFVAAVANAVIFDPRAVIAAYVPARADLENSNSVIIGGEGPIRMRLTYSPTSTVTGSSEILVDTFLAINVKQPQYGVVVQG